MSRARKLHCCYNGCPFDNWDPDNIREHQAQEHVQCACHRWFLKKTIYRHQHRCSVYRMAQQQTERTHPSVCDGCQRTIHEGQHYLLIPALVFQTNMPVDYVPVCDVPDTKIRDIVLCTPGCLADFARGNSLLRNVFGSWIEGLRRYEMVVNDRHSWYSFDDAVSAYGCNWWRVDFGTLVREPDGTYRGMTDNDRRDILRRADEISASK